MRPLFFIIRCRWYSSSFTHRRGPAWASLPTKELANEAVAEDLGPAINQMISHHRDPQHDPVKAAELLAQMPSSRSKALSSVALAKTWGARDGEAATAWARQSLTGPVKQAALLEIAASSGGPDPLAALQLVEEAGWSQETNFHAIAGYGNTYPSEVRDRPTPGKTAGLLLQQLALLNPAAAQSFLEHRVPGNLRAVVAKHAGIVATP